MGAWGLKTFENDDAADWIYAFDEEGVDLIASSLKAVMDDQEDYLDAPVCCEGLAAAELVAAARSGKFGRLSKEAAAALKKVTQGVNTPENVALAQQAVARIKADSELKELWEETDEYQDWVSDVGVLEKLLA
jgi:Domain of unknown function (DUF4259)